MNVIIIPTRLLSSRLPNKLLLDKTGYPLLWHTIQRATESKQANAIIVATEDNEITQSVNDYNKHTKRNIQVIMTGPCDSGTDRIAIASKLLNLKHDDIVVNLQGDEPELEGNHIDALIDQLEKSIFHSSGMYEIATIASEATYNEATFPSIVKVVVDNNQMAMYFSRSIIPYSLASCPIPCHYLKHIGIYAYRFNFLNNLDMLPQTTLSSEKLEQLQWLQAGFKIKVIIRNINAVGIDTPDEYEQFVKRCCEKI